MNDISIGDIATSRARSHMTVPAVAAARLARVPPRRMRATPRLAVLLVLGCILQLTSAAIDTLKTHGDLNAAMMQSDRVGVLVWFGGAYESLQLPASESDTREAAWFTKLDHIWQRDVLTNKIAWIQAKNIKLRFARADPALMPAREKARKFPYSEPSSVRLLWQHEYSAPYEPLVSRAGMRICLQWVNQVLNGAKVEL